MDSYRTLVAWQLAHELCIMMLRGIDEAYQPRAGALLNQLRRAIISIEANVVEGYALGGAYLRKQARIAFGSAAEADILMRDAVELGYLPAKLTKPAQPILDRCMRTLRGLMEQRDA